MSDDRSKVVLKLHLPSRARLWAELVSARGERVFVPTSEPLQVGNPVTLEVDVPDFNGALVLEGTVVSLRPAVANFPQGVQVNLDAQSVARCTTAVAMARSEAIRVGRVEPRVDLEVPARVLKPVGLDGLKTRNISQHGLALSTPVKLEQNAAYDLQVALPGGEATFQAKVMWSSEEKQLAGLRITSIAPPVAARLNQTVEKLLKDAPPPALQPLVVIADDDPITLDLVAQAVSAAGYRILRSSRGDHAMELIRRERPSLVLLDVLMPGLDGHDVCQLMRADPGLASIPVALVSSLGEPRLTDAVTKAGANDKLSKPVRFDDVQQLVRRYLKKR
jgi:CheY-like chemotaxis protein